MGVNCASKNIPLPVTFTIIILTTERSQMAPVCERYWRYRCIPRARRLYGWLHPPPPISFLSLADFHFRRFTIFTILPFAECYIPSASYRAGKQPPPPPPPPVFPTGLRWKFRLFRAITIAPPLTRSCIWAHTGTRRIDLFTGTYVCTNKIYTWTRGHERERRKGSGKGTSLLFTRTAFFVHFARVSPLKIAKRAV